MTADLLNLLTAAVDGELSPQEQWSVHRLLAESAEAQTLFARLQSDSIRLRNLSATKPPANFVARVMARLPKAVPAATPARRDRSRQWVAVAIAASLLLALTATSFWLLGKQGKGSGQQTATGQPGQPAFNDVLPNENAPVQSVPPAPAPGGSNFSYGPPLPPEASPRIDEIPAPRIVFEGTAFPPLPAIPPLERVLVRVPFLASLASFDQDDIRKQLTDELARDPAFRIDLFVKDATRGVELFQAAAKANGLTLFVDAGAQERLKRKQANAYLVYAESLTPAEIRDLFVTIATDDAKNPQRVFDALHVTPALPADAKDLKDLLGTDPGLWKRSPAHTGAVPPGDPKPISASTGDQLTKSLTSPGKAGDKSAILLSFTPAAFRTNPALSKELKEFLAKRGDRKASAVPILIVIRQSTGG